MTSPLSERLGLTRQDVLGDRVGLDDQNGVDLRAKLILRRAHGRLRFLQIAIDRLQRQPASLKAILRLGFLRRIGADLGKRFEHRDRAAR